MYYRRCESCGSKALATATRCPKCEAAFELNDSHGKRHRLIPCPNCEIVEPANVKVCRWCGADRQAARVRRWRRSIAAAGTLAAALLVFAVYDDVVPLVKSAMTTAVVNASEIDSAPVVQPVAATLTATTPEPEPPATPLAVAAVDTQPTVVATEREEVEDAIPRIEWEEAKATTWVNVRAHHSRDAAVVAVLSPDDVVRLGATSLGWRQVNIDGATGWVDPRHFEFSRQ